jgi:ribosome-associated protein
VTLCFDLEASPSLTDAQKERVRRRLGTRLSKAGLLRVVCGKHRSQAANRALATERFAGLLRSALARSKVRRKRGVPAADKRRRLEDKKRRGRLKKDRSAPSLTDRET